MDKRNRKKGQKEDQPQEQTRINLGEKGNKKEKDEEKKREKKKTTAANPSTKLHRLGIRETKRTHLDRRGGHDDTLLNM